jgi:uncharacterized protein YndB with AHSA1/START domain
MTMPAITRSTVVPRSVAEAFELFTAHIGAWWPLPTHGVFEHGSAGVAFVDGRLVERSLDGRTAVWGEVLEWTPPSLVRFTWHAGRGEPSPAGEVEVSFTRDPEGTGGTRVLLVHRGWEAYGQDAARRRHSYVGPNAWGSVLDHYNDVADPLPPAGAFAETLAALETAYETFWTAAGAARGTIAPPGGEWDAPRVMAHVATNDESLAAVCRALLFDSEDLLLDNAAATGAGMELLVASCEDDVERLVAIGRRNTADVLLLLRRLTGEQRARPVHAHLVDSGRLAVDAPLPWEQILDIQARRHLPGHTEQLSALVAAEV